MIEIHLATAYSQVSSVILQWGIISVRLVGAPCLPVAIASMDYWACLTDMPLEPPKAGITLVLIDGERPEWTSQELYSSTNYDE